LKVPAGFKITRFAQDLGNVRVLAVASDGTVYATRRDEGDVLMLKDPGNGGPAGAPVRVARRSGLHGIALHHGQAYLATVHEIFRAATRLLPNETWLGEIDPSEVSEIR
jgi:hypothetical protein